MNASSSECSSGCDSGWTLYFLPPSSSDNDVSPCRDPKKGGFRKKGFENQEEEDLSMVSDASSAPPVRYNAIEADEAPHRGGEGKDCKRQRMNKLGHDRDCRSLLDDTASSPAVINNQYVWKDGVEIPEGERSAYQQHFGCFHSHHDNQWVGRKNMKKWT